VHYIYIYVCDDRGDCAVVVVVGDRKGMSSIYEVEIEGVNPQGFLLLLDHTIDIAHITYLLHT